MEAFNQMKKWQMELASFKGIKSTFILEGNISDLYPIFKKEGEKYILDEFDSLNRSIGNLFNIDETAGFYSFLYCDPLHGFSDPLYEHQVTEMVRKLKQKSLEKKKETQAMNDGERPCEQGCEKNTISELIKISMTEQTEENREEQKSTVNVIDYASRFLISPDHLDDADVAFFLNLHFASRNAIRGNRYINTLILVTDKLNDIPAWFYLNNPHVRTITIPNPDRNTRQAYIEKFIDAEEQSYYSKFVDLTAGMKLREIQELLRLRDKSNISKENIADVVTIYKYGFKENMWAQIREKFAGEKRDMPGIIRRRVKGQEEAIDKIVPIIKRSVVGLSGLQHSSGTKPRGILFLAGPTGTGKTEVVKAVTEMLFEDEKMLIRFDMSEYAAENADQKLFGAPPGYVGYDNGGQLTNAVKSNPFSVLLFDEIEKAHPSIMDKFLQILEDGRMTDGQGNTVYFTETLIFFTSNEGINENVPDRLTGKITRVPIVHPGEPYEEIRDKVEEAVRNAFKPEVINRIGENIVVFNFINKEASREIADSQITNINKKIEKEHKITVLVDDSAKNMLYTLCESEKTQKYGGRGIGNVIEEQYLNPLARYFFDNNCGENDVVSVYGAEHNILSFTKSRRE